MVLRENLDFKNINIDSFKSFKCLCELCQCGCFERNKEVHAVDCKKQASQKQKLTSFSAVNTGSKKCSLSHYKDTFKFSPSARPATTYVPQPDLYLHGTKGEFSFNTEQKTQFKEHEFKPRLHPFKFKDNTELSKEAVSGVSSYLNDFKPTGSLNFPSRIKKDPNQVTMPLSGLPFVGKSITSEHFVDWDNKLQSKAFTDPPSYVGQSLFPTAERFFTTSTGNVHDLKKMPKKSEIQKMEARGNLTFEGIMDFKTSNRVNFVDYPDHKVTQPIIPHQNEALVEKGPFKPSFTQNQKDFVYHPNHRPPRPADCNPYLSKVENDLYPGSSYEHKTTQRVEFPGINVSEVGLTKSCKAPDVVYVSPTEKVLGETTSMRDFKPIDITQIPILKAVKRVGTLKVPAGPMETQSLSQVHFMPYDVKMRVPVGDLHPGQLYPPIGRFATTTTTGETFQGKKVPRRLPFQPDGCSIDIKSGSIDFNTSYAKEFKNHGLSMCEAKAYLIAKALHDKRILNEQQLSKSNLDKNNLCMQSVQS